MNDAPSFSTNSIPSGKLPFYTPEENANIPSVFISYSQFSEEHKSWVVDFATKLSWLNIFVEIDANLDGSETLTSFMNKVSLKKYVICVCSESYVEKVLNRRDPTGASWEFDRILTRSRKEPLEQFVIPIHKDSSHNSEKRFIPTIADIDHFSFETEEAASISFMTIAWRILDIKQKISNISLNVSETEKFFIKGDLFNYIQQQLLSYWSLKVDSKEARCIQRAFISGNIYNNVRFDESSFSEDNQGIEEKTERIANLIGKWDTSHDGDTTAFTDLM